MEAVKFIAALNKNQRSSSLRLTYYVIIKQSMLCNKRKQSMLAKEYALISQLYNSHVHVGFTCSYCKVSNLPKAAYGCMTNM